MTRSRMPLSMSTTSHGLIRFRARRNEAKPGTLRACIIGREPPGWSGLERLLGESEGLDARLRQLAGTHLALSSEDNIPHELASEIRLARPGVLSPATSKFGP